MYNRQRERETDTDRQTGHRHIYKQSYRKSIAPLARQAYVQAGLGSLSTTNAQLLMIVDASETAAPHSVTVASCN